jgi:hypothetical protein
VDEDLMNQVASVPRLLQPYVMETTEVKDNLAKYKKALFARKWYEIFLRSLTNSIPHSASNQKQ